MSTNDSSSSLMTQLQDLSAAEDFFLFFGVPYDQKVLDVSRLHIMKRFFQYLRQQSLPDAECDQRVAYRDLLARAYNDFVVSTPAQEKVFKVFQDTDGRQHVTLDSLRASLPSSSGATA